MRFFRLAICLVAFAVFGKVALAEDVDVRALRTKLAEQEARLNDLQAKISSKEGNANIAGAPEQLLSLNKNACVTIGGTVNTRYFYQNAKMKTYDDWAVYQNAANPGGTYGWTNGWTLGTPSASSIYAIDFTTEPPTPLFPTIPGGPATLFNPSGLLPVSVQGSQQQATLSNLGSWVRANIATPGMFNANGGVWGTKAKLTQTDLRMSDAKLKVKIDVNDYFDAFLQVDLISSADRASDNAEIYWVRWKNICNSGFGIKVGRDALVFGQTNPYGVLANWTNGGGDGLGQINGGAFGLFPNVDDNGNLAFSAVPSHNGWDIERVMQVTPYWEALDGKLRFELSFMQQVQNGTGAMMNRNFWLYQTDDLTPTWKSKNWGFGTMSARVNWMPIEGLDLQASVMNYYDRAPGAWSGSMVPGSYTAWGMGWDAIGAINAWTPNSNRYSKNNTAVDLGFKYRPSFLSKMMLWGQWIHGWKVNQLKDVDSDVINAGLAFDFNESFSLFAQGDYLRTKDGAGLTHVRNIAGIPPWSYYSNDRTATGWASYIGAQYKFGYGVMLEAGWRHEEIKYKNNAAWNFGIPAVWDETRAKVYGDTIYAHLGFDF